MNEADISVRTPDQSRSCPIMNWEQARRFSENLDSAASQLGGKGWNLLRLHEMGFDIPPGGIIPTHWYQRFLQYNKLDEPLAQLGSSIHCDNVLHESVQKQLKAIQTQFESGRFPDEFERYLKHFLIQNQLQDQALAVRSSANAEDGSTTSFAGIHHSYLNVRSLNSLLKKIKACYASLWTQQALAYRRKMNIEDKNLHAAVVLMQMVQADASGVAFSCDPGNGREDIYIINANFGLGETVVNGTVEPDHYVISNWTFQTQHLHIGSKAQKTVYAKGGGTHNIKQSVHKQAALNEEQRKRLALLINRVFDALGNSEVHQDIEWVLCQDKFYLVQARPVTALPEYRLPGFKQKNQWSNGNYRDGIPMVLTLMQRYSTSHTINNIILKPLSMIGYPIPEGLKINRIFNGRAYFNLSLYQWLAYDALGTMPQDLNHLAGGHQEEIRVPSPSPFSGKTGLARIKRMIKNIGLTSKLTRNKQTHYDRCLNFCLSVENQQWNQVCDQQLLGLFTELKQVYDDFGPVYMILHGNLGPMLIAIKVLDRKFPGQGANLVNALMAGKGRITSAEHGYELIRLAQIAKQESKVLAYLEKADFRPENPPPQGDFSKAFTLYLEQYGHRGPSELDTTRKRWREDPSGLLQHIRDCLDLDREQIRQQQRKVSQQAMEKLSKLGFLQRKIVLGLIRKGVYGSELREWLKSILVRLCSAERILLLEAARRLKHKHFIREENDIFHCSPAEMISLLKGYWQGEQLQKLIELRKQEKQRLDQLPAPDLIVDNEAVFATTEVQTDGKSRKGIAVSAGVRSGKAKVLHSPDEARQLEQNEVLVAPATDPSWTPLFLKAGALVMETGGYTSHGSIVAREFGLPAVVNLAGALQWLNDEKEVVVNGDLGTVYKR